MQSELSGIHLVSNRAAWRGVGPNKFSYFTNNPVWAHTPEDIGTKNVWPGAGVGIWVDISLAVAKTTFDSV